ncbi:hypothetical protein PG995_005246 [Apiospora arundinis]
MKCCFIRLTALFLGWAAAGSSGSIKRRSSSSLDGAMSDVLGAAQTLDHVVGMYSGGDAEDIECAINTAVVVLRQVSNFVNGLVAHLTSEEVQLLQVSIESLDRAGERLVKSFAEKIPIFNEARICNSITTDVLDLGTCPSECFGGSSRGQGWPRRFWFYVKLQSA